MTRAYSWRIVPLSTFIVGAGLVALVVIGSVFAFNSYVAMLRRDTTTLVNEALSQLAKSPPGTHATDAAQGIATRLFSPALIVVFIGTHHRVTVFHPLGDARGYKPVVAVRGVDDRSAEPAARGAFARLVLGAAAICGLPVQRAHYGSIDIYAKQDDAAFVASVREFALPFAGALALALLFSVLSARLLTRQALRPLEDVTAALERFAAADFRPQFVATNSRAELGKLARAYNGAVAQVESAFDERERANAAMRQFIADAGHQLRTPLTVIRGFITLLGETAEQTRADREHMLRVMGQQSVLMGALIDNLILLDGWENHSATAPEIVDVTRLLDDIVTAIRDANEPRTIAFTANGVGFARIDPRDLTYAVTNIVDNALKYTAGDVSVDVDAGANSITVTVRDAGPGMTAEVARHAFDRFYRGQRRDVAGSGLGLAIAKKAVERAGGTIELSTAPERETTIRIALPRAA
ncbi:MAG TPA: HAMP domain-containing sensor histidine kinase [Candidatus Limnocylindria bacterium]|jgi:signal transduction histidine kinase|nr:HAMP domain-containing sensor histidine kinase [Candidatus Limnocylindria bacterium]